MHSKILSQTEKALSSISVESGFSVNVTLVINKHCGEHSGKSNNQEPAHQLEKSEDGATSEDVAHVI